ncbi:hypothetical protein AC579_3957 [Pseudocercospora musae]|uniref:Uncharacterized protein n=1 Tax=Pseudocercospora musae TaxID=113226 RepID=A0A139I1U7_9PEZI|nr:hypothetical protein AC579_3957 [Pseudocercospora musae]
MMNEVVSANDFATASFEGAVDVADLVMRNKYLETELTELRNTLGRLQEDEPSLEGSTSGSGPLFIRSFARGTV